MSTMSSITVASLSISLPIIILVASVTYVLCICLYRLTLHPLARFPGPKTAAISRLHAMYYDVPYRTSYVKEFATYHDIYDSPIVRIEPGYLHIRDIDAYNEIFKVGTKFTREPGYYSFPTTKGSLFNELGLKEGIAHRALYSSSFSKREVIGVEPRIREHLTVFLRKLDEASRTGKSVNLTLGFRCLQGDTLMRFMYDQPLGALESPGFQNEFIDEIARLLDSSPVNSSYGGALLIWVFETLMKLPRSWVVNESMTEHFKILDGFKTRVLRFAEEPKETRKAKLFETALDPSEKKNQPKLSIDDLAADGVLFFAAGLDTVANALVFGTYNLIRASDTLQALRTELFTAISEPQSFAADSVTDFPLSWSALDKLPYLHGVVKESIRMSFGVPGNLPRIVPPGGATLAGQFIPAGTVVSSSSYSYFTHPNYYHAPQEFRPERWIPDSNGEWRGNNGVDPEKYFVAFTRGSRICIGMDMAYAQLKYTLAYIVRNFDMILDEGPDGMKDGDMDWHDAFAAATFGHLKVKFQRVES